MLEYITNHYDKIITYTLEHLQIVLTSFGIALLIAVPVGFLIAKQQKLQLPIVGLFNIIYAIPSLVLYTLLIPVSGLGMTTAIIALVLYSQFSLVKNIAEGFNGVDKAVLEAGRGMGLSKMQLFSGVELPLALPVILSGMRLAITSITTMATLAATIGAGGLGTLLFDGLRTGNWNKILIGTVLSSAFVLLMNLLFQSLENHYLKKANGDLLNKELQRG